MTTFWRDGHYRNGSWVEGHWVTRDDWDHFSPYVPPVQKSYKIEQTEFSSFVTPNATCPICGGSVFYYENSHGSKVWFDDLGPPWSIHGCFEDDYIPSTTLKSTEKNIGKNLPSITVPALDLKQENKELLLASTIPCTILKNVIRSQNSYLTAKVYDQFKQHRTIFLISEASNISTKNHICFVYGSNIGSYKIFYFDIEKMQHGSIQAASIKDRKDFLFLAKHKQKDASILEKIRSFVQKIQNLQGHTKVALADWLYNNTVFDNFSLSLFSGLSDFEITQLVNGKLRSTHIPQSPVSLGITDDETFSFLNETIECVHAVI